MKTTSSTLHASTFPCREMKVTARLLAAAILAVGLLASHTLRGATVTWKAANVAVYLGLPSTSLEFENPLSGAETVLSYPVLEWRDADFSWGPPPWYDDWMVSHPTGIDGDANEIWMRQAGHWIQTTTTSASTMVSIHMTGDSNDGLAAVAVDNIQVATLDMYSAAAPQTVLLVVKGLPNTTHIIQVSDNGVGQGGSDDVAVFGAAALKESKIKWDQPPAPADPDNLFYGWNEMSVTNLPPIAADDWVCTSASPITKIRWWGSFLGWASNSLPPFMPNAFQITIWSDLPVTPGGYSQPDVAKWQTHCTSFSARFVGWDYDPRIKKYEACFLFEQDLPMNEWFYQEPGATGTNIYWISIAAEYWQMMQGPPWGWKTRPRDPASPAPDDAVRILQPLPWEIQPGVVCTLADPIWWPDPTNSWDLAFELISSPEEISSKWQQLPDLSNNGIDVNATGWTNSQPPAPPYLLADDFLCTQTGPITNITIWASWFHDYHDYQIGPSNITITLSFHNDIPAGVQAPWSMPGAVRWVRTFTPAQYKCSVYATGLLEGWLDPPGAYIWPGDFTCFQYDFSIPAGYFVQEGSPANPITYWLDVQANLPDLAMGTQVRFGWKTSVDHWNDAATWVNAKEAYVGPWQNLLYPPGHPYEPRNIDLAFRLNAGSEQHHEVKWSQPPKPYHPTDAFNGWNEKSVLGSTPVVADDWVCTNRSPITDIHWWGSFIGWSDSVPPQVPEAFRILFWTDIPAEPLHPYSQPGEIVHEIVCTNFTYHFVGWDIDPRDPTAPPEACFKFEQDLLEHEWWQQDPANGTNVYWISIEASYMSGQVPQYPWGWKTRPRDPASLAPDDAVRLLDWALPPFCEPIWWPYETNSWDLAFALTTKDIETPTLDFGDTPRVYPTLLANNGARHTVAPGVFLGASVDAELDGQPSPNALGDDNNPPLGPDDEDGITLVSLLIPGELAGVQIKPSVNGYLSAWVDFGADGSWAEPGDQIFTNMPVVPVGMLSQIFTVPLGAARGSNVFARFRFSTVSNAVTSFTGQAPDGEVEDYQWHIEELDFGDAPDPSFPTLYASNGARHWIAPNVFMGALIDSETDGQPNANASGDNAAGLNDEDGVTLLTPLAPGQPATVQVVASIANCILNAWIDFGADGSWATPGDQIANNLVLPLAGANVIGFVVPPTAVSGTPVFARFRLSTMANLSYTNAPGVVPNGEVEDYQWRIADLDFGDAPDPAYPTLLARGGAHHAIGNLRLGALVDAEPNGQPDPNALGDDNNPPTGLDDEDGVVFTTALISGVPASVQVTATAPGLLQGWIDWNRNGSWAEANEQVIINQPVLPGANTVSFSVPNGLPAGKTYARFRLSSLAGLPFTGYAPDGEVEDYAVTLYPLKWLQPPEQGYEGVDVDDSTGLADDFQCTQSGPITDIHIWGSFRNDLLPVGGPGNMTITLAIYDDVPVGPGNPYSHPSARQWTMTFNPGQYQAGNNMHTTEWWHNPAVPTWIFPGDTNMYQLDFYISPLEAFRQVEGKIYWLGVSYAAGTANYSFGWKTTPNGWNDDACWLNVAGGGVWQDLHYGGNHPLAPKSLDLAFALSGPEELSDLDFGDAPRPYPTVAADNGARHFAVPGFYLGKLEDTEPDGQPHPQALGDDNVNLADEDGMKLTTPLLVGTQACINVFLTAPAGATGLLDAWMDFNANGAWDPAEQIFNGQLLLPGINAGLCFAVPGTATLGTNFARFRLSSAGGLGPTGAAQDGEVEDYMLVISQRRPLTNIVITNIVVTNLFVTNQVVGLAWTYENSVHYQVRATGALSTNITWYDVGPVIIGPNHWYWETNLVRTQKFYRVVAPFSWP